MDRKTGINVSRTIESVVNSKKLQRDALRHTALLGLQEESAMRIIEKKLLR